MNMKKTSSAGSVEEIHGISPDTNMTTQSLQILDSSGRALLYALSEQFLEHRCQVESLLERHFPVTVDAKCCYPELVQPYNSHTTIDTLTASNVASQHKDETSIGAPLRALGACINKEHQEDQLRMPGMVETLVSVPPDECSPGGKRSTRNLMSQSHASNAWLKPSSENPYVSDIAVSHTSTQANDLIPDYLRASARQNTCVLDDLKEQARRSRKRRRSSTENGDSSDPWYASYRVRAYVSGRYFESILTFLILSNAVSIGVQSDWVVKNPEKKPPIVFDVLNTFFTVAFALELSLRLYAFKSEFFLTSAKDFNWNLFDFILVLAGLMDEAVRICFSSAPNLLFIRFLRVMRLARVVRLIRVVRFCHDLRVIVAGIMGAMRSLIWACGLLFMIMFMVSVCFVQLVAEYLPDLDSATQSQVLEHFGSLIESVYTLYLSISGGVSWGEVADNLRKVHVFLVLIFCGYIAFAVLCVLNIITGVFVENAANLSQADDEQLLIESLEQRMAWFDDVKALFDTQAGDKGALDYEAFKVHLSSLDVQACFRKLGIDTQGISSKGLFQVLDFDQKGLIEFEEFVLGIQMLHGTAKAIDLARIRHEVKGLKKDLNKLLGKESDNRRAFQAKLERALTKTGIVSEIS